MQKIIPKADNTACDILPKHRVSTNLKKYKRNFVVSKNFNLCAKLYNFFFTLVKKIKNTRAIDGVLQEWCLKILTSVRWSRT